MWTGVRERKSSMTSPIAHGPNRGRNHGVVQACGPTTRSLANTTFRRSHTTMSAASKRATIIAWGTLDGMKTVVNVNQRAVFVSIRTGIMTARDWSARPSTTLADLFTQLLFADFSSAVRASLRPWSNDEFDDGVTYGRQARLRRWTVDSFFSAPLVRDGGAGGTCKRSWS